MHLYEIAKFFHFLGLVALAGFFIIYSRAGPQLRKAKDMKEVQTWLGVLQSTRPMMPAGAILLLLSGLTMGALRWKGPYPFMVVGLLTLLVIWIGTAIADGRHLRAMRAAASGQTGAVPPELSRLILNPTPWATLFALNLATFGVLFVMTTKIGWIGAISVVAALAIIGAIIGSRLVRGDRDHAPSGVP